MSAARTVLIVTRTKDGVADLVSERLRARSAEVIRLDPRSYPRDVELSVSVSRSGRTRHTLSTQVRTIDLDEVTSGWFLRLPRPAQVDGDSREDHLRRYAVDERASFVTDVCAAMSCPWLPGSPLDVVRAGSKLLQLQLAASLGFELPPTLITNRRADLLEFYRQHDARVVRKPLYTSLARADDAPEWGNRHFGYFTEVVSMRDVGYAHDVRACQVILQAYVPKRMELRITVIGDHVFPIEIHSQRSNRARHDSRHADLRNMPHAKHDLPHGLEGLCRELVARLRLRYGAIDMVLTPDGRYVFLEINPSGQYQWGERLTKLPMTDALCSLLLEPGPTGARP